MAYIPWKNLAPAQRLEAIKLRPQRHPTDFKNFAFWVKADGHLSRRGGHHELLEGAYQEILARFTTAVRNKGDLAAWKPGVTFHFSRG